MIHQNLRDGARVVLKQKFDPKRFQLDKTFIINYIIIFISQI